MSLTLPDLLGCSSTTGIGDSPGCLLPCLELGLRLDVDEDREDVSVYNSLYLLPVASGNVGDGPAGLLPDALLRS